MHGKLAHGALSLMKKLKSSSTSCGPNVKPSCTIEIASYQSIVHDCSTIIRCHIIWLISFMMTTVVGLLHCNFTAHERNVQCQGRCVMFYLDPFSCKHTSNAQRFQIKYKQTKCKYEISGCNVDCPAVNNFRRTSPYYAFGIGESDKPGKDAGAFRKQPSRQCCSLWRLLTFVDSATLLPERAHLMGGRRSRDTTIKNLGGCTSHVPREHFQT